MDNEREKLARACLRQLGEKSQKVNFLIDDCWRVIDDNDPEEGGAWEKDLASDFFDLDIRCQLSLKIALLEHPRFRVNGDVINCKIQSAKQLFLYNKQICNALRTMGCHCLADINASNVQLFYLSLLKTASGNIAARRSVTNTLSFFKIIYRLSKVINLPDYPQCIPSNAAFEEAAKKAFVDKDDYLEWMVGGSLGGIPVEMGLILLDEALKTIRDKNSSATIFGFYRLTQGYLKGRSGDPKRLSHNTSSLMRKFLAREWRWDSEGPYAVRKRWGSADRSGKYNDFFSGYLDHGGEPTQLELPGSVTEVTGLIREKLSACAIIILMLSGARRSELDSLSRSSFEKDSLGNATFKSEIVKTNHSIETERVISETAYEAAQLAIALHNPSEISGDFDDKLLKVIAPWHYFFGVSLVGRSLSENIELWCTQVLKRRIKDFDPDSIPLNPHAFRHLFAEFALRRFDGNVSEALRRHFRHAFRSWMTYHYTRNKIKMSVSQLGRDYMRELLGRAAYEEEELYGPVGRYILEVFRNMRVVTDDDIEAMIDEFDVIEPHEYGYCMIRKKQKTQARCYDKATQTPQYGEARFAHCGGCVGSLRLANHRDAIMRIGMREQAVLEDREDKGLSVLAEMSRKILRLCEAAYNDFDRKISTVDVTQKDEDLVNV